MRCMIYLVAGLVLASLSTAAVASDCTAAFCPSQQANVLSAPTAVVVPQQAVAVQSEAVATVAVPSVVVQRARPMVVRQRVVTLRRTPVRNFLFGQRSIVRARSCCR